MDPDPALTAVHGILVVDKPRGLSSATVVAQVKHALGVKRAGHGGTLDPLATGVLAICLGGATRLAPYLLADDKAYEAEGVLGIETDTLDRTGEVTCERAVDVSRDALEAAIAGRRGDQTQVPPMYSAIKQGGVRLYHRARAGEHVERAPRAIRVDRLELLAFEPPMFRVAIDCTKGTYVRSLIADLGTDVGAGAHLTALRRTRSGRFTLDQAVTLEHVVGGDLDVAQHLIPMTEATSLPIVVAPDDLHGAIRSGNQLPVERFTTENYERFQLVDRLRGLLAVVHVEAGRVIYDRVFPESFPA